MEKPINQERVRLLLNHTRDQAIRTVSDLLDHQGVRVSTLALAMDLFIRSLPELPRETDCRKGCAWCCHLRVGVSIPEVLVISHQLIAQARPEGLAYLSGRVRDILSCGNTLEEKFWQGTHCACPFLDTEGGNACAIYGIRPFACRAFHSIRESVCKEAYDRTRNQDIPCFPIYRASVDMYSTVFIQVMARRGLASFQVGFIRALDILLTDRTAADRWLSGEDVFLPARLTD